jgi:NADH-quinone oxidoreductase subunit M
MFASIGLPGLSGFVGEFLVALATLQYSKWVAFITFSVVIFAAWYMMWMFQRVIFGRQPEDMPDPHDGELTPDEIARLERAGLLGGHGHGHGEPLLVSGASHDAVPFDAETRDQEHGQEHVPGASNHTESPQPTHDIEWPDLNRLELWCLLPLAVLTIVFGVYPKPILDIAGPAFERILLPFMS